MGFVFDPSQKGLETVMKDYQVLTMRFLWEKGEEGVSTAKAWLHVSKILMEEDKTISRASIINFLKGMHEEGIVNYWEGSGKGGSHRIYYPVFDEAGFKEFLATQLIEKLLEEFPDETNKAILKIMDKI